MSLTTRYGQATVEKRIGAGAQGDVYLVTYNGMQKALKWFHDDAFLDKESFIRNLQRNIDSGSPAQDFLWPLDITEMVDGTFGYIMDLKPAGYYDAGELFIHPDMFPSFKRIVDVCLNIVHAFRILHDAGYVYRDINGGNFFINPSTGKVLVCDNDNVGSAGEDSGIRGTPRFMAPEIVLGNGAPTEKSDLHSLAVIIFYLLLMQHPLEGRRADVLDWETNRSLYGTDPLFIFDPNDDSNRIKDASNNAEMLWLQLPAHMRDLFIRAFSQDSLLSGKTRPNEIEWVRELVRFRSEIALCPKCKNNEVFIADASEVICDSPHCSAIVKPPLHAEFSLWGYRLPALDDMRVYRCQTEMVSNTKSELEPLAWVLAPDDGGEELGIRNIASHSWQVSLEDRHADVNPGQVAPLRPGLTLHIGDGIIRFLRND